MSPTPHRVLLVGAPRGGTTWVAATLARTAGARLVHEPDGTGEPFALRAKRGLLHHPMLEPGDEMPDYERLWAGAFAGGGRPTGLVDRIVRRAFRHSTAEQRSVRALGGPPSPALRVVERFGRPLVPVDVAHVVVKSVNATFALDWITIRFAPDVGIILRHPLDVLASWQGMGWSAPSAPMYAAVRARAARRWRVELPPADATELERTAGFVATLEFELEQAAREHGEWVTIRHEDACATPEAVLAGAAERLGLRWSDDAARYLKESDRPGTGYATNRVRADQPGRWRERLDGAEQKTAIAILERFHGTSWLDDVE